MDLWGIGLDVDETTPAVRRAAALAFQLPPDSRVMRAFNPQGSHSDSTLLLRQMEYVLRQVAWSMGIRTQGGEQPMPIGLAGEEEAHEREVDLEERNALEMAASFGLNI